MKKNVLSFVSLMSLSFLSAFPSDSLLPYDDADGSVSNIVSWVDTSLDGSEKFVLRVDGKPFYPTNIQVRLDKLYGYKGWDDSSMEAVIKQASDDGFNTLSIPVHWREIEPVKDVFNWSILDKYMGWCRKYNLKMELLWFSWSSGGRVQYLWNVNGRREPRTPDYVCSISGTSEYNVLHKEWEYSLDWRDAELCERETYVVGAMMEHIAQWDSENGSPHTVIGVQLGNEPRGYMENEADSHEIIDYYSRVGEAVKKSPYVVWTRLNCVYGDTFLRIKANEEKREQEGTYIDFVGIDVYGGKASKILGDVDGQLPEYGKNYRMIMEAGADDSDAPVLQIAALAGDKAFDYYNMAAVDGNCLYNADGTVLKEKAHIKYVRQRNKMLNLANQEIALKSHKKGMFVYNSTGSSMNASTGLEGIRFKPGSKSTQAIAVRLGDGELLLLATSVGSFEFPENMTITEASYGYMDSSNEWMEDADKPVHIFGNRLEVTDVCCIKISYSVDTGISSSEFDCKNGNVFIENGKISADAEVYTIDGRFVGKDEDFSGGVYVVKKNGQIGKVLIH